MPTEIYPRAQWAIKHHIWCHRHPHPREGCTVCEELYAKYPPCNNMDERYFPTKHLFPKGPRKLKDGFKLKEGEWHRPKKREPEINLVRGRGKNRPPPPDTTAVGGIETAVFAQPKRY